MSKVHPSHVEWRTSGHYINETPNQNVLHEYSICFRNLVANVCARKQRHELNIRD